MDAADLKVFEAVVRLGSMSRASEGLGGDLDRRDMHRDLATWLDGVSRRPSMLASQP